MSGVEPEPERAPESETSARPETASSAGMGGGSIPRGAYSPRPSLEGKPPDSSKYAVPAFAAVGLLAVAGIFWAELQGPGPAAPPPAVSESSSEAALPVAGAPRAAAGLPVEGAKDSTDLVAAGAEGFKPVPLEEMVGVSDTPDAGVPSLPVPVPQAAGEAVPEKYTVTLFLKRCLVSTVDTVTVDGVDFRAVPLGPDGKLQITVAKGVRHHIVAEFGAGSARNRVVTEVDELGNMDMSLYVGSILYERNRVPAYGMTRFRHTPCPSDQTCAP